MNGLPRLVLHLEVAHEMDDVLQEGIGESELARIFDHLFDLGNG